MEEIMIVLNVNVENFTESTREDLKSKVNEYVTRLVGNNLLNRKGGMSLESSALVEEIYHDEVKTQDQLFRIVNA